mmetsp:Transcript_12270/g.26736  ORF Transcript_12270/g.26736 Transcript_12270/m.26736 type:complete len:105 (+) Transcript_12270:1994-2308(+)
MIFLNEELIELQRSVMQKMLKKVGANLFAGKSIMEVSLPVCIFSNSSMLTRQARMVQFVPKLVDALKREQDALQRFGLFTAWFCGFQCLNLDQYKPFNPIWGET